MSNIIFKPRTELFEQTRAAVAAYRASYQKFLAARQHEMWSMALQQVSNCSALQQQAEAEIDYLAITRAVSAYDKT